MAAVTANVRIRPLRFGFAIDPQDRTGLHEVFRLNTTLWGGIFNFLIPITQKTPQRYRDRYFKGPTANQWVNGLVEAFQPDLIVETKPGIAEQIRIDKRRIIPIEAVGARDEHGRCTYGMDIRTVCAALYEEAFRFVQRHPAKVVIPHSSNRRFDLLFAAAFGEFTGKGPLSDCAQHYRDALNAKDETFEATDLPRVFKEYLFPLRVGRQKLETRHQGWSRDPTLFYMDEQSTYDLIEFWNLRAIGWRILPLPRSLTEQLRAYCERFVADAYKPFPPPSNAFHHATFLCSRSCRLEQLQAFVSSLRRSANEMVSTDPRIPRLWEEWGRSADNADPQEVTHENKSVEAHVLMNDSFLLPTALPEFAKSDPYIANESACVNVLQSLPGGAAVIPWQTGKLESLTGHLTNEAIWLGREGIVTLAGEYAAHVMLRLPSPINVFSAFAQGHKFKLTLSPAGQNCEQVISALGGLQSLRLIAAENILHLLDRLAHGDLEVDVPVGKNMKRRRARMASAPHSYVHSVLATANNGSTEIAATHLQSLIRCGVLKVGMRLPCSKCSQNNWYGLEDLGSVLKCERCMREFDFPSSKPPRNAWAYRVIGPFAVEGFANGAYCVAIALHFLQDRVARACTWIPSFRMSADGKELEADFGMFLTQHRFSHIKGPLLIFGECKTFGSFSTEDFKRARSLAKAFPGSVLCFATLRRELNAGEKNTLAGIASKGRASLKTGQQANPVLVLTGVELFGQFDHARPLKEYGPFSEQARLAGC